MNKRRFVTSLVTSLLVMAAAVGYLVVGGRPELGLDLQGGISAVYTPVLQEGEERPEDFDEVLDETIAIIRDRVDSLGVAEPEISRQGDDVLVQLPGLDDPQRAQEVIGTTAELSFRTVEAIIPPGAPEYDETPPCDELVPPAEGEPGIICSTEDEAIPPVTIPTDPGTSTGTEAPPATGTQTEPGPTEQSLGARSDSRAQTEASPSPSGPTSTAPAAPERSTTRPLPIKYRVGPAQLTGDRIEGAIATLGQGGWVVQLDLDQAGGQTFEQVTSELACRRDQGQIDQFAIVLDGRVESAPQMNPSIQCGVGIQGGSATITVGAAGAADGGEQEARDLALVLKTGALPITLEPSTFETVSPTLGAESLQTGLTAGLIGLALVALYLLVFYRWLGLVAVGGLLMFGSFVVGLISLLGEIGFTLTLAGVAGIVVSIGIAADSSIIFFERIRDEVALGKTVRSGVKKAFRSAFRTNLTGNTTTLAAALVLYFLAVGPVRGFALTLGVATVLDIVILYFYTRPAVNLLALGGRISRRSVRVPEPAVAAGGGR